MISKERLAAHLLNLYWTGAGDAGTDRCIFKFHQGIESTNTKETLGDGEGCRTIHEGKEISQAEYFLLLADKIVSDLIEEKYREARSQIKAGFVDGLVDTLALQGHSVKTISAIKAEMNTAAVDIMLGAIVANSPEMAGDLKLDRLIEGWLPKKEK
jgi:hypothetical protein